MTFSVVFGFFALCIGFTSICLYFQNEVWKMIKLVTNIKFLGRETNRGATSTAHNNVGWLFNWRRRWWHRGVLCPDNPTGIKGPILTGRPFYFRALAMVRVILNVPTYSWWWVLQFIVYKGPLHTPAVCKLSRNAYDRQYWPGWPCR